MSDLAPTEILALARILENLDYYQLLHLGREATPTEIRRAYQATARAFHPDGHRDHGPEVRTAVELVAKRVTEAYSVLRNPRLRQVYDRQLETAAGRRVQLSQAEAAAERVSEERQGQTPQGRQYFKLAERDIARGDLASAVRNLQTAFTFEPTNAFFKERLAEMRKKFNETPSTQPR